MDITLATFTSVDRAALPGMIFTNAWAPSSDYANNRLSTLTGQYYQRKPRTRITDIFGDYTESVEVTGKFRLLEEPDPADLARLSGVIASVGFEPCVMALHWPGVAEGGECHELVSPLDLAPTLAAIAGMDVRPNAPLSFDGMNLIPVVRYGAAGHGALFFDDGTVIGSGDWQQWHDFMALGPLQ